MNTFTDKKNIFWWLLIAGMMLFEFLLFRTYALREIVEYYPVGYDQSTYLLRAYSLYEKILNNQINFSSAKAYFLATTIISCFQSALFFLFVGASRFNALLLNFIYFVLFQLLTIQIIKKLTGNYIMPLLFLSLTLFIDTPLSGVGGMIDFRVDFMAFCLYGMLVSSIMRSLIFIDRKWSVISALLASFLVLMRTLTFTYIVAVSGMMIIYFLVHLFLAHKKNRNKLELKKQLKNSCIYLAIVLVCVSPFLWVDWYAICNYYWVGHVLSPEKNIRAIGYGTTNLVSFLTFYPYVIVVNHLRVVTIWLCAFLVCLSFFMRFSVSSGNGALVSQNRDNLFRNGSVFLILSILLPLTILTIDVSKSPIVGGITVAPFLWLVIWISSYFWEKIDLNFFSFALVTIFLIGGCYHWVDIFGRHSALYYNDNKKQTNVMYEKIASYAENKNKNKKIMEVKRTIKLMPDELTDYLVPGNLSVIHYENTGVLLETEASAVMNLLSPIEPEKIFNVLKNTGAFIVNVDGYPNSGGPATFPYSVIMSTLRPQLIDFAEKNFELLGEYRINHFNYRVYVNPRTFEEPLLNFDQNYFMDNTLSFLEMTGFAFGENTEYRWTVDQNPSITLYMYKQDLLEHPQGYINFDVQPFLYAQLKAQHVNINWGSNKSQSYNIKSRQWFSITYERNDWEDVPSSEFEKITIHFNLPNATAPHQADSLNSDPRTLALNFIHFSATENTQS